VYQNNVRSENLMYRRYKFIVPMVIRNTGKTFYWYKISFLAFPSIYVTKFRTESFWRFTVSLKLTNFDTSFALNRYVSKRNFIGKFNVKRKTLSNFGDEICRRVTTSPYSSHFMNFVQISIKSAWPFNAEFLDMIPHLVVDDIISIASYGRSIGNLIVTCV
jgi:hypothetical protein